VLKSTLFTYSSKFIFSQVYFPASREDFLQLQLRKCFIMRDPTWCTTQHLTAAGQKSQSLLSSQNQLLKKDMFKLIMDFFRTQAGLARRHYVVFNVELLLIFILRRIESRGILSPFTRNKGLLLTVREELIIVRSLLDEKSSSVVPGVRQLNELTVTATQLPLFVENCMEQFEEKLLLVATSHLQMLKVLNKRALSRLTVNDLPKDLLSLAVAAVKQAAGPQDMVTFSAVESAIKSEVEKFCQMLVQKSVNQITPQGPLKAKNTSDNSQPGQLSSSLTSNGRIQLCMTQVSPPCTSQAPLVVAQISSSAPPPVARTQVCPGLSSSAVRPNPPSVTTWVSSFSEVRHKPPSVTTWVSSSSEVSHKPPSVTTWVSASSEVRHKLPSVTTWVSPSSEDRNKPPSVTTRVSSSSEVRPKPPSVTTWVSSSSEVRPNPPSVTTRVSSFSEVCHKTHSVTTWVSSSSEAPPSVTTWDSSSSEVLQGSDCQPTGKVRSVSIYPPLISLQPPVVSAQISPSLAVCQFAEHQPCEPYPLLPSFKSFDEKREQLFGNLSQRRFSNTRYWGGMEVPGLDGLSMQVPDFDHRSLLCNPPLREASIASHAFVSSEAEIWSSNCTVIKYHRDLSLFRPSHAVQSQISPSTSSKTFLTTPAASTVQRCTSGHHMQKMMELATTDKHKLRELKKDMVDLVRADQHEFRDLKKDPATIDFNESREVKVEIVDPAKIPLHESRELKEEVVDLDTTAQRESKELKEEIGNVASLGLHECIELKEKICVGPTTDQQDSKVDLVTIDEHELEAFRRESDQHESRELKQEMGELSTTHQHDSVELNKEIMDLVTIDEHEIKELMLEAANLVTTDQQESRELKSEIVNQDTIDKHGSRELKQEIGNLASDQYISGDLKQEISKTGMEGPKIEIDFEENLSFSWVAVSEADSGGSAVPWAVDYCSHQQRSCEVQLKNIAHHPHWGHLVRKFWRQQILAGTGTPYLYLDFGAAGSVSFSQMYDPDHSIIKQK
jgi:hypothetical protein